MSMENVNNQQLAVAANMSATQNLDSLVRSKMDSRTNAEETTKLDESALKKALDGKQGQVGVQILAGLAAKMAKNLPTSQILDNLREDYKFVLDGREESANDSVDLKSPTGQYISKARKQNLGQNSQGSSGRGDEQQNRQADVKEYIGAYSQMLLTGGQEIKRLADNLERQLISERGVSVKDVQGIKTQVATAVRQEILTQIKQSFLKNLLTKEKSFDSVVSRKELDNFMSAAFFNDNIGGYDFGGGPDQHLQGAVDRVRDETKEELREFIKDELTDKIMKKAMGNESRELGKEIEDLLKLGQKVGFDVMEVLAKIPDMKENLGLNPVIEYEYAGAGADMNNDSRQGHRYQYTKDEEKEIMTDKLRAIYMRRAMQGDLRAVLETQFKMIKTKNGLIKLGVSNFEQFKKEGEALAKYRLYEMLKEAFEERATYAKLSGEAWNMTERKIKTVLKNMERLGADLSQTELDTIRDRANEKMHREAEHELSLINMAIQLQGEMKYLTTKRKLVLGILERLAQESGLQAPGDELKSELREAC